MTGEKHNMLWLELALTPEVQPRFVTALVQYFKTIEEIFSANHLSLGSNGKLPPGAAGAIVARAGKKAAEEEAEKLHEHGIGLITFGSKIYPPSLREIHDPPPVMFMRGEMNEGDHFAVSVVGSRHCSAYGAQVAHRLAGDLAKRGITVISGLANGIDQAAHNGALAAGGRTIAVLGSGLGNIYPRGSEKLVERIEQSGAVLSEFPYAVPPSKSTFPQRNRIVSGMSHATLVVEAGEKSGALITARLTLEQGHELLAVPGPIYSKKSLGSNYLIKTGAKLVQTVDDIIDELPESVRAKLITATEQVADVEFSDEERSIMEVLSIDTPQHIDIIAAHLGMSTADLSLLLLGLEMRAVVKQLPGMEFIKTV